MTVVVCCTISFLIGGIPFGYLVGRFILKDDIRNHGSGNIGATNVGRVIGWKWGGLVLLLDAIKGLAPTAGAMVYATKYLPASMHLHLPVAAGISAIVGHMYPVYLKLRGGKGVATALGVVIVLAPKAVLTALAVFLITLAASRLVALASMLAATAFGITSIALTGTKSLQADHLSLTAFAVAIPALIIWRHRSNISRMLSGREPAVTDSPSAVAGDAEQSEAELPEDASQNTTDG